MKKLFKNVVSTILVLMITVTCLSVDSQEIETETNGVQFENNFLNKNNMTINGADTLGNMLAQELSAKSAEQTENNGYNIFSVEIEEGIAKVSFETLQNSSLLVALYDNEGSEMIVSGYTNVTAEETEALVEIDSENIPEYFYIRAYLINPETLRPLSLEYSSPMYTQKMQDFLSKDVNDFDSYRVINLDEKEDTNFAVFREDTKIIPESSEVNIVISANDETLTYVFGNIDENITSLKSGDFFAYNYQDNLLIVKVNTISINGKTATVIGQDMELEEVFEHLRIDGESFSQDAKVDTSDLEEGITYEGLVTDDESGVAPYG
ncbi:MAG: fibronectin, partial [Ruminiclostridium sp.]|nr:fibronectin [Ruminiclostridium sp.]